MADKRKLLYMEPQLVANVIVDNDNASEELVTELQSGGEYLYMEKLVVSVYDPSEGGGQLELKDSTGDVKWRTNTDGMKDLNLDFPEPGFYLGRNTGIKAVVSGSQGNQAGVSVMFQGFLSNNRVITMNTDVTQSLQTT
jgi:hypothetical protein